MMGHGWIYTLSIVSIFHLKDGPKFANFFKSFLAAEFMRHTLIPIIKTGREWTFLIPRDRDRERERQKERQRDRTRESDRDGDTHIYIYI